MVVSMDRWVGKVAIVTGASAGIGAAIAEQLVAAGLLVAGLARRKDRVEQLSKKLSNKKGKLYAVEADITKEDDILKSFKWVKENLGPIHILINNAGIGQPTTLHDGDTEMWKKVVDTNIIGLCIATREAVKDMRANKVDGHIVHINSVAGHYVPNLPGLNIYTGTKYAVTALTETLRQELNSIGSKIRITSVSPGYVDTEIREANNFAPNDAMKTWPILQSEDIADGVIYALSTPPHVQVHELMIRPVGEPF